MSSEEQQASATLQAYCDGLNNVDVDQIVNLYAKDGVFMPQHFHASIGRDQIRQAYTDIFKQIRLEVKFTIVEVVVAGPKFVFARTTSSGVQTVLANGTTSREGNQELFVLQKGPNGGYEIARYCFCTTNPPK